MSQSAEVRRRRANGGRDLGEGTAGPHARAPSGSRCMKWTAVPVLLAVAATLLLWLPTTHVEPIAFKFSESGPRPYEGALEINSELRRAELLFPGELVQPEAFVRDGEGYIYTGLGDGRLVRLSPDLSNYTTVLRVGQPPYEDCGTPAAEDHCGRILGLQFHPTRPDVLYAADSSFGLLKINTQTRRVEILARQRQENSGDTPFINFCNDVVVLANGSIFFTDSSRKFRRPDVLFDIIEGRGNGQLLHFDPGPRKTHVVLDGLPFPNGMCLSHDETALLIAETTRARIMRYHLKGPKEGTTDIFLDNLPGLPDNISPNSRGDGYWVAFAHSRTWFTDYMVQRPTLRLAMVKLGLARLVAHNLPRHGLVLEVDTTGHIRHSFHDEGGQVVESVSHVLDLGDRRQLLLGSYEAPHAAVLTLDY